MLTVLLLPTLAIAGPWQPSVPAQTVIDALQPRHPLADCASLEQALPSPAEALTEVVEHAELPPWLPLRAATCLAQLPQPPLDQLRRWALDPATPALAKVTARHLSLLPEPVARELAQSVLEGPHAALFEAWRTAPAQQAP